MPRGADLAGALRRLGVRVALFLGVALLPIGLIAVVQTVEGERVARQRGELTLLALTERAAFEERQQIQRSLGTAQMLATALPDLVASGRCDEVVAELVARSDRYSQAGYVEATGDLLCSAEPRAADAEPLNFSDMPGFTEAIEEPRPRLEINTQAPLSGESVLIASHPVDEAYGGGFVFVSLPHARLGTGELPPDLVASVELITFNTDGAVLTSSAGLDDVAARLPVDWDLVEAARRPADVRQGEDALGRERTFAVVPILHGTVYGLGSWPADAAAAGPFGLPVPTWAFPILMWVVSLVVAYVAVHRLVIRHMKALGLRMRDFAENRRLATATLGPDAPVEVAEMGSNFDAMAERILREEAETENRLHEQRILLREVHHRVKNNLQLISSIINIQMRQIESAATRQVLRRIQDRVLGLATIHRNMTETEAGTIPAHTVLRDIVDQLAEMGALGGLIEVGFDMDPLEVFPDQAVPLSLFVTEATTNAVKYIGRPEGGEPPWIRASLKRCEDGSVVCAIVNSKGAAMRPPAEREDGSGLGNQLIRAFAMQLEARPVVEETPGAYSIAIRFRPPGLEGGTPERPEAALRAAQ